VAERVTVTGRLVGWWTTVAVGALVLGIGSTLLSPGAG
jgi:hypothetical protein